MKFLQENSRDYKSIDFNQSALNNNMRRIENTETRINNNDTSSMRNETDRTSSEITTTILPIRQNTTPFSLKRLYTSPVSYIPNSWKTRNNYDSQQYQMNDVHAPNLSRYDL